MELEYKWKLPELGTEELLERLGALNPEQLSAETYEMNSKYYDTEDGMFTRRKGALRLREENGKRICCVKLAKSASGACTKREEYEIPSDSVQEGLLRLCDSPLGLAFCIQALNQKILQLCSVRFTRQAYLLRFAAEGQECQGELAVDRGSAEKEGVTVPIAEVEFEFKSGSEDFFHRCAGQIRETLKLEPQTLPKLAQIMEA